MKERSCMWVFIIFSLFIVCVGATSGELVHDDGHLRAKRLELESILSRFSPNRLVRNDDGKSMGDFRCATNLRIFSFRLPPELRDEIDKERLAGTGVFAGDTSSHSQFALSDVLYDLFTRTCVATLDARRADFYYVPLPFVLSPSKHWERVGMSIVEAILNKSTHAFAREWRTPDGHLWRRRAQFDVIIPVSNIHHFPPLAASTRHSGSEWMNGYIYPMIARPVFIGVEFPLSLLQKSAIRTACINDKNIQVPYPSFHQFNDRLSDEDLLKLARRTRLVSNFYGKADGACPALRPLLLRELNVSFASASNMSSLSIYSSSFFCPCPIGYSPASRRKFTVIEAGCMPLVVSDQYEYPYLNEVEGLDQDFYVRVRQRDGIDGLRARLEAMTTLERLARLKSLARARRAFQWYLPSQSVDGSNPLQESKPPLGGAAAILLAILEQRVAQRRQPPQPRLRHADLKHARRLQHLAHERRFLLPKLPAYYLDCLEWFARVDYRLKQKQMSLPRAVSFHSFVKNCPINETINV